MFPVFCFLACFLLAPLNCYLSLQPGHRTTAGIESIAGRRVRASR